MVSDIGTRMMGAGFVDEGIAYEEMAARVDELEKRIAGSSPVCPVCKSEMTPMNFKGYYDEFACWTCDCESFDGVQKTKGGYA